MSIQAVLRRGEGQLWFAGVMLWGLLIVEVGTAYWVNPELGRAMMAGIGAEVFTGRESGIPTAIAAGVPPELVFQISLTQDIASALIVYPLFLLALHHWYDADNYLMRRLRAIEAAAQRHEKFVKRWGPTGIGLFMLVPFMVNGPLVGLIVGRLAGMYTRYVLPAVVIATAIAAAMWTVAFESLIRFGGSFSGWAGWFVASLMVVIVLELAVVDYLRERRHNGARRMAHADAATRVGAVPGTVRVALRRHSVAATRRVR